MFESTISVLIASVVLLVLALFIPCVESLVKLLRRKSIKRSEASQGRSETSRERNAA